MRHRWDLSPGEAVGVQKQLAGEVRLRPFPGRPKLVAGVDVSFNKFSPTVYAGIVVLETEGFSLVDSAFDVMDVSFPYVPGLLSFREIPPLLNAWARLRTQPEVVVADGQGIAHPRRLGIASHLGLLLSLPAIGCGKSRLVGVYREPGPERGASSPLFHRGEEIGTVLRTKRNVRPLFVSPGHLMDIPSARRILLDLDTGYRLPEPTRRAHLFVNELRIARKPPPGAERRAG